MGIGRAAAIATTLIEHGWPPGTPAAVVVNASAADQHVWRGTLDQLTGKEVGGLSGPATIIIGDVVSVAADAAAGLERKYVTGT
jgi:siroheme synthase